MGCTSCGMESCLQVRVAEQSNAKHCVCNSICCNVLLLTLGSHPQRARGQTLQPAHCPKSAWPRTFSVLSVANAAVAIAVQATVPAGSSGQATPC